MSTAVISRTKRPFYEKLILSMLSKMDKGTMNITMPGGEQIQLGDGSGNVVANVTVNNSDFFKRCVLYGDIGFGEAYVDGDWDTDNITDVIKWFIHNIEYAPSVSGSRLNSYSLNFLKGIMY